MLLIPQISDHLEDTWGKIELSMGQVIFLSQDFNAPEYARMWFVLTNDYQTENNLGFLVRKTLQVVLRNGNKQILALPGLPGAEDPQHCFGCGRKLTLAFNC